MIAGVTDYGGYGDGFGAPPQYGYGPPSQYGYGAPPQFGYGAPGPIPTSPPTAERIPPGGQILISALLILPTIAIFYAGSRSFRRAWLDGWSADVASLVLATVLALYYVVVVVSWARRGRRRAVLAIVLVVALVDLALAGVDFYLYRLSLVPDSHGLPRAPITLPAWVLITVPVLVLVGYVAAWGMARRRNGIWVAGLIAAVACGAVVQWIQRSLPIDVIVNDSWWIKSWALHVGAFVLSCLICWALDAIGSRSRRAATNPGPLGLPRV